MTWQLSWYLFPLFAAVVVSLLVAGAGWYYRNYEDTHALVALMLAIACWSGAYTVALGTTDPSLKLLAYKLIYSAMGVVPVAWVVFAIQYTGRARVPTHQELRGLLVVPALTVVLVWTNEYHGLVWSSISLVPRDALVFMTTTKGAWFWVFAAYSYVLIGAGAVLLARTALLSDRLYRDQAIALGLAVLLPVGGNVLYVSGVSGVFDPTNLGFAFSGTILMVAVFRRQLLQLSPATREIARDELIDSMTDAVLVVDEQGQVADLNPAAESLIDCAPSDAIGRPVGDVCPAVAGTVDLQADTSERVEFTRRESGDDSHYEAQSVPLRRGYGTIAGQLITVRDITDRHEQERELRRRRQRLEVLNRVLRHDIRNGMNVVLVQAEQCSPADPDTERALETIKEQSREIVELGEKARRVKSAIEGTETPTRRTDVVDIIERSIESLRIEYPNAEIRADMPDSAPVTTSELIDFAIRNVIENAIEHNDSERPTVEVTVTVDDGHDGGVEIRVADDGPGIPAQERAVIEEGRESALEHGGGLGLWLVNWILEDVGGELHFGDNQPRGTVVTVQLPKREHVVPSSQT